MKQLTFFLCLMLLFSCKSNEQPEIVSQVVIEKIIDELNKDEIPRGEKIIAIVGATLIDGNGGNPLANSLVIIENEKINYVGVVGSTEIPAEAEIVDADGLTLLPGLIDAHYHNDYNTEMPTLFLSKGVTSVRDPGAWMDYYQPARDTGKDLPRLFLTGPHLDTYPPAYPDNSYLIKDEMEGRLAVNLFADRGATAIKVYLGLSIGMIKEICDAAHERGIPVSGHLETANAKDAILAGMDGVEHVTSFGTVLIPMREAEKYKKLIANDKNARRKGRYEVWNSLDLESNTAVKPLIQLLKEQNTFVCPTLAVFEKQYDQGDSVEVNGFDNMVKFVGLAKKGGAKIVVGSHTWVPYAKLGFAYFREMELLKEAGLSNMEIIVSATMENARFFRVDQRLGSIEKGKLADLLLLSENPLENIVAMRSVKKVMLNGKFLNF
jgi:imidazolonepropionase-like amidohydrolase